MTIYELPQYVGGQDINKETNYDILSDYKITIPISAPHKEYNINQYNDIISLQNKIKEYPFDEKFIALCGDHSALFGLLSQVTHKNGLIIWIDSHHDQCVPENSPSGNFHGMVGAALSNRINPFKVPCNYFIIWIKTLDELDNLLSLNLNTDYIHVSIDVDAIKDFKSTGIPVGRLPIEDVKRAIDYFKDKADSWSICEYRSDLDSFGEISKVHDLYKEIIE